MPFYSKDIWVVLRARDVASTTIAGVGKEFFSLGRRANAADRALFKTGQRLQAMGKLVTTFGIGLSAAGLAGAYGIKNLASSAEEFQRQAALAATQVHNGRASAEQLERISISVARAIPVPIEQLNKSLFDIFSSTDIKVKDSAKVLKQFSVAAVAGQDDIINVGRAAISILNSWDMPLKNLTHVFDVQFKMVQLGVGTYSQFASTLGRAIPSVRAAGQSFEFLAGTMAFLTRRGQSTAQAAVAIARLTDLFRRPDAFKALGSIGSLAVGVANSIGKKLTPEAAKALKTIKINALDASGHLRPINQLLTEMAPAFAKLSTPERSKLFKNIFGGEGTIQARRFFDLAIDRTKELNRFIKDVGNAAGSTKKAYSQMAATFAAKSQLLKNNWEILKIQLGNALIPYLTKFIDKVLEVVKWFQRLSPHQKDLIAKFMLWGTAIAIVGGIILTFVGFLIMLAGGIASVIAALGIGFVVAVAVAIGWILAIAAVIGVLAFLFIKYHKQIFAFAVRIWNNVSDFFVGIWQDIYKFAVGIWTSVSTFFVNLWQDIYNAAMTGWNAILNFLKTAWRYIRIAFAVFLSLILLPWIVLWNLFGDRLKVGWNNMVTFLKMIWNAIANFFKNKWNQFKKDWNDFWNVVTTIARAVWNVLQTVFRIAWNIVFNFFKSKWQGLVNTWLNIWDVIKFIAKNVWKALSTIFKAGWKIISDFFTTAFKSAKDQWNGFVSGLQVIWNGIKSVFSGPINWVIDHVLNPFIRTLNTISKKFGVALNIPQIGHVGGGGGGGKASTKSGTSMASHGRALAFGGMVLGPGGPRSDLIHAFLSNGEFVVNAGATSKHRQLLEAINANKFAKGGIVGTAISALTNPVGTAVNFALRKLPGGDFLHSLISGLARKFVSAMGNVLKEKIGSFFTSAGKAGSAGSGQLANWINAALLLTNTPLNWAAAIRRRIMFESGGNPNAINLSDINARRGDPSRGLMQTIMATFRAFHQAGTSMNIYNPIANIAAAINYIKSRYGSIFRIDPPVRGYDRGGFLPPGLSIAYNGTGRPEPVGSAGGTTQNFYIYTQEIDPRRHAQQLGWELANH